MRIAFNPSTVAALTAPPDNKDITFDLRGRNIFARGVKFQGTDTWRPVVDNLTSDSTTSSLSANQGRILAELINSKSDSEHNHDDRYLRLTGGWMSGDIAFGGDNKIYWGRNTDSASISFKNDGDGDSDSYMSFVTSDNGNEYFRWSHSSGSTNTEWMALRSDGLRVGGTKVSLEGHTHDDRYVRKSGDTMLGALNFANGTWNLVGDDSYMGDCNISGHFGIKAANTTYPGIAFFNNANAHLGSLTAYSGNIKYGAYSLQFLDNGNTSVSASTWMNPFSDYNSSAVADGQAICVWGQSSSLSNLAADSGDMSLWLRRVNANVATLNMVLDGEYYANGNQRLAHVSEIPSSLRNPYALTISLNGTSQGPYDGSAAKNINITPSSIGAATSDHNHINYLSANGHISGNIDNIWTHGTYGFGNRSNYTGTLPGNSSYGGFLVLNPQATTTSSYYTTQIALLPGYFGYRIYDDNKWYDWKEVSMVGHNHDDRYVRYYAITTLDCNDLAVGLTAARVSATNAAHTNHSAFLYISDVGTPFQIQIPDSSVPYIYKRYYGSGGWSGWFKLNAGYADSAGSATKLQTSRLLWGQPFDGTADVDNTLRIRQTTGNWCEGIRIQNGDNTWATIILGATGDTGTNTNAWSIHRKDDNNFAISRNSSDGVNGLVMTSVGMGLGTTAPTQRLDVAGNIRTTGNLYISHTTNNNMNYDTSNPRIVFSENGSQTVGLVYTDYDSYRPSKGLKVMDVNNDDISNVWFEVQGYNYSSGYVKNGSNDNYVLLGGGGHKLESALSVAYSKYLTGITLTGGDGNNEGYRLIFERTMGGWTINYGVWAIALRHSGRGTLNIGFDTTNSDGSTYTYNIRFLGSTASRESTPFRAFYNTSTKVFRIYWHYYDYTSGDIAVLRGNMEPYNGTWMTSLPNDVGTELAITCNMADQATNADMVDGYHASELLTALSNTNNGISITVGGTTKSVSNISVNYAASAGNADTTDGVHITWAGELTSTNHLVAWEADGSALRDINPANITVGNADMLDGYHENSFLRYRGTTSTDQEATLWNQIGIKTYHNALPDGLTDVYNYGSVISLPGNGSRFEIYASHISSSGNGLYYRSGWNSDKKTWLKFIDSSNIGSQSVNYANSAGNADTVDGYHASDFSLTSHNHDGRYVRAFGTSNDDIDSDWGQSFKTFDPIPSGTPPEQNPNISILNIGENFDRRKQLAFTWNNDNIYYRRRVGGTGFTNWVRLALINDVNNYYWANVKISTSANTQTQPSVNTIYANNWFRSQGYSGWYNESFGGGIWMNDSNWIKTYGGKSFYCDNQIYSSNSIKMSNILLEHTDEINNSANGSLHLNYRSSGNVTLCIGGGNVGISHSSPSYKLDVNGQMRASGFHHGSADSDNYMLLAGGGYKSFGGNYDNPIFLGYLDLDHGNDGTISSSFYCLGYSVSFTYTRGGNYCKIYIPDTSYQVFYIKAAIASVNYSGGGMDTWTGNRRGDGSWWLHCYASGSNEVRVKGFCQRDTNNDSWWGGNPLWSGNGGANKITVCIFGYVTFR